MILPNSQWKQLGKLLCCNREAQCCHWWLCQIRNKTELLSRGRVEKNSRPIWMVSGSWWLVEHITGEPTSQPFFYWTEDA